MEPEEREKNHEKVPEAFHFSRLRRRQDVERKKKERRREWMRKAYLLSAKDPAALDAFSSMRLYNDGTTLPPLQHSSILESSGAGVSKGGTTSGILLDAGSIARDDPITPKYDETAGQSEEDLLRWSMALNYEDYARDWAALATSLPSDITFQESMSLYTSS